MIILKKDNFFNIINMVRSVNLADIDDYNVLKAMVGSEELDGAKLFERLDEAKRQTAAFKAKLSDINSLISSTIENNTRQYARKQLQNYDARPPRVFNQVQKYGRSFKNRSVVNDTYDNEYVSDHNGIVNYFSYK